MFVESVYKSYTYFDINAFVDQGVSRPRKHSITGAELPSPRFISMNTFSNEDRPLEKVTSLLMQFGQFINHDMESTSQFSFSKCIIMIFQE